MKSKLPILLIVPHGGRQVPDELSGYEAIDEFGVFIESDTYANEIFNISDTAGKVNTRISRLFVDLDRPPVMKPPYETDGVIKQESQAGRKIFKEKIFPDNIAITNILRRYYTPFFSSINKTLESNSIKLILECHTMMPVGPRYASDAGRPRPLINIENIIKHDTRPAKTCSNEIAQNFLTCFKRYFASEEFTVSAKFTINKPKTTGYILEKFGQGKIPMLRFSISSSLYLNEKYFNYDYLTVDEQRISDIRKNIRAGLEKYASKYL